MGLGRTLCVKSVETKSQKVWALLCMFVEVTGVKADTRGFFVVSHPKKG